MAGGGKGAGLTLVVMCDGGVTVRWRVLVGLC